MGDRVLVFPRLKFYREIGGIEVYLLDWEEFDEVIGLKYRGYYRDFRYKFDGFGGSMEGYFSEENYHGLSEESYGELGRCIERAGSAWGGGMEEIAELYVGVVFGILGEGLFDKERGRVSRSIRKWIRMYWYLFRFWQYQVGSGSLYRNSMVSRMEERVRGMSMVSKGGILNIDMKYVQETKEFYWRRVREIRENYIG